jgi:hypothetical protein
VKKKMPNPGKLLFLPAVAGELQKGPRGTDGRQALAHVPPAAQPCFLRVRRNAFTAKLGSGA